MPASIVVLREKSDAVRRACTDVRMRYEETSVEGRDEVIRFSFRGADGAALRRLLKLIPEDVFAYRAIIGEAGTKDSGP